MQLGEAQTVSVEHKQNDNATQVVTSGNLSAMQPAPEKKPVVYSTL